VSNLKPGELYYFVFARIDNCNSSENSNEVMGKAGFGAMTRQNESNTVLPIPYDLIP
jgi:hypothetical protein